jgi:hypothetical protein
MTEGSDVGSLVGREEGTGDGKVDGTKVILSASKRIGPVLPTSFCISSVVCKSLNSLLRCSWSLPNTITSSIKPSVGSII